MELRPDASHKENVPLRLATPLRPEQRRLQKSLDVGLASRHGQWVPKCQAKKGEPAATPSLGAALHQEPWRVQSNLASPGPGPGPSPGLALMDTTGRLINSRFQQQRNLQPLGGRPQGRAQQSNLSLRGTDPHLWSEPQESFQPHVTPWGSPLPQWPLIRPSASLRRSQLLAKDTACPDVMPKAGLALLNGHTWPDPISWCGLGSWTPRLEGEPLTLEDLAIPTQSQAWTPSQAAIHQLLASVRRLEQEAVRLRCWASREPPGPARREPWTSAGQAFPAHPQPSQPGPASWDERKKHRPTLRETAGFLGMPWVQGGLTDAPARGKPASLETALGMLTGDALDPEQGVLPAHPPRRGEKCSLGTAYGRGQRGDPLLPQGAGSSEARLCSPSSSSSAPGILQGQEGGEGTPGEQVSREEERPASCPPDTAPVKSILQNRAGRTADPESETAGQQWLSRCFRAWQHLVQRRRAVAAAVALGRRQLLRRGLQALKWAQWLREAQLEAAWGRHTQALLARTFQKWRNLIQQQKQGQPRVQAGPGPSPSGGGQDRGPSVRKTAVDIAQKSSPGSLREETGTQLSALRSGRKPDGGDRGVQIPQPLQQLAVFLLECLQKEWARREKGVPEEAPRARLRTQRMEMPPQTWHSPAAHAAWAAPLDPQQQRAWLCRCFGAWQRFVQRGTRYRVHVANRQAGTLRMCLQRWVRMKQLRASDGAKVIQLSLCQPKAGTVVLLSSAAAEATALGLGMVAQAQTLPQDQSPGSLQEACRRRDLHWALLLWRTRLSQRQQANSFFQDVQQRALCHILRGWHMRTQDPGTLPRTTLAPVPLGGILGGEAWRGCSPPHSSLEKASRAPVLLEMLLVKFLRTAGQRQQGRCLLLWQARAQQSRGAARWHLSTLQRRILLGWSHWAAAQGARRELAARWAQDRRCRAVLGLWWRRLVQQQDAERWAWEQSRRLQHRALGHWHSCWQRQQLLREKYQKWVQGHLWGLRGAMFRGWRQAAAHRRATAAGPQQVLKQNHFQARGGFVRDIRTLQATCAAFQDGLRQAPGATSATWWETLVAAAQPQAQRLARASFSWRSRVQGRQMDGQLRRAWAQQASLARVLEAWAQAAAQGRVQRAVIIQFQQAGPRRLLRTHWAQGRTARLRVWLKPKAEARTAQPRPRAALRHWPRLATRGRLLVLTTPPALGKQTRSCRPQPAGPGLPSPTQHHSPGGQKQQKGPSWAQRDRDPPLCPASQLLLQWPRDPKGKGEARKTWLRRKYLQRWRLETLLRRLQGSQQARCLAATWQCWVDAWEAEQLAWTLLRQWHLRRAWRLWRQRVLRLQVAQRFQQREDSWVLSQAFERWRQRLAARSLRSRARGAARGLGQGWEQTKLPDPLPVLAPAGSRGPSCNCSSGPGKEKQTGAPPIWGAPWGTQAESSEGQ